MNAPRDSQVLLLKPTLPPVKGKPGDLGDLYVFRVCFPSAEGSAQQVGEEAAPPLCVLGLCPTVCALSTPQNIPGPVTIEPPQLFIANST